MTNFHALIVVVLSSCMKPLTLLLFHPSVEVSNYYFTFSKKSQPHFLTFKWNIYFWLWKGKNPDRICSKWKIIGSFRNVQIFTINLALQTTLFVWMIVKQSINTNKVFTSNMFLHLSKINLPRLNESTLLHCYSTICFNMVFSLGLLNWKTCDFPSWS